jgi:hypothetical protein
MLHDETDRIAAAATSKTLVQLLRRRYGKRRSLLVMKRAEAEVVAAPFFEFHETAYYIYNVQPVENLLYGILGDQISV